MEKSEIAFPGFLDRYLPDHLEYRKAITRLQNKAPQPLQVKSTMPPLVSWEEASKYWISKSADSVHGCSSEKLPIPLLSPLVLPPA